MISKKQLTPLKKLALAALLSAGTVSATSAATNAELAKLLEKLTARVQSLEQANADLQRQLAAGRPVQPTAPVPAEAGVAQRLLILEQQTSSLTQSLGAEPAGENEPAIKARLKAVEAQTQELGGPVGKLKPFEGMTGGLSLTMVAQKSFQPSVADSQLGYRADAFVSLPLEPIGEIQQSVFTQFRLGQGAGLTGLGSYSKPNATAFGLQGGLRAEDSVALLAQAWYQASIPLPMGGPKATSRQTLEVNVGKMDPFVFFDQNAVAGDETRQFLNSVFVHNPLLDAGGDIGVDANGFAPGLRLSLLSSADKQESWRLSLALFGAGDKGANYQRSLGTPMVMLQAETSTHLFGAVPGNYRVYAWSNPQAVHFDPAASTPERHTGWGLSLDQRVGEGVTLFARYGHETQGHVKFDRALTIGTEVDGAPWGRGGDSLGLALGWLGTSEAYRSFTAPTSAIHGQERVGELYYRFRVGKQFELSPGLQYIARPGSDPGAQDVRILGLRSQFNF